MSYTITTDSCSDLSIQYLEKRNIGMIPLIFTIDGKDHFDDKSMSSEEFFALVRSGKMSKSSLINAARFEEFFTPLLEKGLDIIHISLSSELSGSHQNAVIAMDTLKEKYPDRKMNAIDSKSASLGGGLLVHLIANKKDKGASYDEALTFGQENAPKICAWFTVDDLNHLLRGGRVSKSTAVIGTLLSIKPIMHIDDTGKIIPMGKAKGRKKSMKALVDEMAKSAVDPKNGTVFISHADCEDEAQHLAELVKERFNAKDVMVDVIGPVIGTHGGPGTLALFFIGT